MTKRTLRPEDRPVALIVVVVAPVVVLAFRVFDLGSYPIVRATARLGFVALLLLSLRQRRRRALGTLQPPTASASRVVGGTAEVVRARLLGLVARTRTWEVGGPPSAGGRSLRIETGTSWRSFGEVIEVHLLAESPSKTWVDVTSTSVIETTVVDYGKNRANAARIMRELVAEERSRSAGW